jgi:gluconolactonase
MISLLLGAEILSAQDCSSASGQAGISRAIPTLAEGKFAMLESFPKIQLAQGAAARSFWSGGVRVADLTLAPHAELPPKKLTSGRLLFVMEGSVQQGVGDRWIPMQAIPRDEPDGTHGRMPVSEFIYLEAGTLSGLRAGDRGAKLLEIYTPPHLDEPDAHLPQNSPCGGGKFPPTIKSGRVYDLYEVPLTQIAPGIYSRWIAVRGVQASFQSMAPDAVMPSQPGSVEQVSLVLRGSLRMGEGQHGKRLVRGQTARLTADKLTGARAGDIGCDTLDIFCPPRRDGERKRLEQQKALRAIIPEGAKVETFVDGAKQGPGLVFVDGMKWLNGKLYLASMYFDQKWTGDPKRSAIAEVSPDGSYRYISQGQMQANGMIPMPNGNLAVCDMFGHRLIEMTTEGQVVRTLASVYGGKPVDGPNDVVTDNKGGFYFTDPQFTPEKIKNQPGKAVYYLNPQGKLLRVIEPNAFAMPNGLLLSPDGKTLFVNNTYDDETWWSVNSNKDEWIWAFDVNDDGTVTRGRRFAQLLLNPTVLDRKARSSGADGMTIDVKGNIFVATWQGVQIFDATGAFVGMINTPLYPVSCCFGGADRKTLYIVGYDKIFRIRTKVAGVKYGPH